MDRSRRERLIDEPMHGAGLHRCASAASRIGQRCAAIAREHGRTFYLASRFLPPGRRRGVLPAYAYCRIADDIVDAARRNRSGRMPRRPWRGGRRSSIEPADPVAVAFAETRARFGIPIRPVRRPVHRHPHGPDHRPLRDLGRPARYCYHVAGTVGLMVAPILGCRDPRRARHAADLGIAMQLTNILRDVAEDARSGRLYLPLDEIAAFGCDPEAILAGRPDAGFPDLMAFQIARARALYADAARSGIRRPRPERPADDAGREPPLRRDPDRDRGARLRRVSPPAPTSRRRARLRALPGIAATFVRLSLPDASRALRQGGRTIPPPMDRRRP